MNKTFEYKPGDLFISKNKKHNFLGLILEVGNKNCYYILIRGDTSTTNWAYSQDSKQWFIEYTEKAT